jgi:hypothetical protein
MALCAEQLPVAEGLFMFGYTSLYLRFIPLDMYDFSSRTPIYGPHVFCDNKPVQTLSRETRVLLLAKTRLRDWVLSQTTFGHARGQR